MQSQLNGSSRFKVLSVLTCPVEFKSAEEPAYKADDPNGECILSTTAPGVNVAEDLLALLGVFINLIVKKIEMLCVSRVK